MPQFYFPIICSHWNFIMQNSILHIIQCDLPNDTVNVSMYWIIRIPVLVNLFIFHFICLNDDKRNTECFVIDDLYTNDLAHESVLEHSAAMLKNITGEKRKMPLILTGGDHQIQLYCHLSSYCYNKNTFL